ncbi:putative G-patch domain protein [Aspergillus homomorphus CBS 101889]|uniref:Putative G-patch domain protein n=1 Tax=Aspergillus homomorphus (strain CBS 101889) TaxID=1450537 RepID=A0A395HKK2_ASPHC|nr:putative G-patch domain protein [Aspergillus homomorphus CBS 101889]RAL07458.1 putative G-patch domain protein [Aspergillus homomorphus CBS 101889]
MAPHPLAKTPARSRPETEEEEDDYMSMIIEEPQQKETFTQKKRRQQREAEARARVPSKAERAADEAARRDAALATSALNPNNKGFQMMAKLGFKPGQALGKPVSTQEINSNGPDARLRSEPLHLVIKEDRGGIGLDNDRKRKFLEEAEHFAKKVKEDEGDYRDRVRLEREIRRTEAQVLAAQKVAERLDAETETGEGTPFGAHNSRRLVEGKEPSPQAQDETPSEPVIKEIKAKIKPTSQINILYRGLVREREEKERDLQTRHMLQTSLPSSFFPHPRLPGYNDPTQDRDEEEAVGERRDPSMVLEQEVEGEDPQLDEFNALGPSEQLSRLIHYLREQHYYCFWCKHRYETGEMEGCPGLSEEDHD